MSESPDEKKKKVTYQLLLIIGGIFTSIMCAMCLCAGILLTQHEDEKIANEPWGPEPTTWRDNKGNIVQVYAVAIYLKQTLEEPDSLEILGNTSLNTDEERGLWWVRCRYLYRSKGEEVIENKVFYIQGGKGFGSIVSVE